MSPLGLGYAASATTFSVFADASEVRVRLVHPGTRATVVRRLEPRPVEPGVWTATLSGDWRGWSYTYELDRGGQTLGDIVDPWAPLVREGRGYVVHDETAVSARPALDPSEAIIYELHLRDFTRDPASGVRADWRGRYLGLAQSGTRLEGTEYATGLDHIVELGVTVVQLMPVHGFSLPYHPEYEWGYMPTDFNAPHAGYASGVELEAPIKEFKRLVSALHERGLRVTLDVVYNHTAERWPARLRGMMALAPREYFRFKDDGSAWDGSSCGNEFRSESAQGRRFIVESCRHWVEQYGIDGFRFDLMGLIDQQTMELVTKELHAIDPTILVYGEPWAGGATPIEVNGKGKQRGRGWGVFNDDFRDGLRGEVFKTTDRGFLAAGVAIERVKKGILGGVGPGDSGFADAPVETINYIECHDNHTLVDRLKATTAGDGRFSEAQLLEMNLLGAMMLLTSQGIPFLHSGQEFGRSKQGHDNTYNLGDQINNIRWQDKADRYRQFAFYRDMVKLRREHPMFRLKTREQVRQAVKFFDVDLGLSVPGGVIAYVLEDVTGRDRWSHAALVFNGTGAEVTVTLPGAPEKGKSGAAGGRTGAGKAWKVEAIDGHVERVVPLAEGTLTLPGHWGAVLSWAR